MNSHEQGVRFAQPTDNHAVMNSHEQGVSSRYRRQGVL